MLLKGGSDANGLVSDISSTHLAAGQENEDLMQLLVKYGADPNFRCCISLMYGFNVDCFFGPRHELTRKDLFCSLLIALCRLSHFFLHVVIVRRK